MPDREKLSDLLYEASRKADSESYIFDQIADYLIAHGVTVQQWIPVAEGLPQKDEPHGATCEQVQVLLKDGFVTTGYCMAADGTATERRMIMKKYHIKSGDGNGYYGVGYESYIQATEILKISQMHDPQAHIVEEEYHFTNADRIRAMSNEQLAKLFMDFAVK